MCRVCLFLWGLRSRTYRNLRLRLRVCPLDSLRPLDSAVYREAGIGRCSVLFRALDF
ncbi:hypothetical protein MCHI_003795 [Candidatus Magnetoovum chiemensis]|nr:hypothetical protein MCHI_003795 [Candidatus Magnetoovum chiemensis]